MFSAFVVSLSFGLFTDSLSSCLATASSSVILWHMCDLTCPPTIGLSISTAASVLLKQMYAGLLYAIHQS